MRNEPEGAWRGTENGLTSGIKAAETLLANPDTALMGHVTAANAYYSYVLVWPHKTRDDNVRTISTIAKIEAYCARFAKTVFSPITLLYILVRSVNFFAKAKKHAKAAARMIKEGAKADISAHDTIATILQRNWLWMKADAQCAYAMYEVALARLTDDVAGYTPKERAIIALLWTGMTETVKCTHYYSPSTLMHHLRNAEEHARFADDAEQEFRQKARARARIIAIRMRISREHWLRGTTLCAGTNPEGEFAHLIHECECSGYDMRAQVVKIKRVRFLAMHPLLTKLLPH